MSEETLQNIKVLELDIDKDKENLIVTNENECITVKQMQDGADIQKNENKQNDGTQEDINCLNEAANQINNVSMEEPLQCQDNIICLNEAASQANNVCLEDALQCQENIICLNEAASQINNVCLEDAGQCQESEFYKKAQDYWAHIPPTVNGMLGGLGYISALDIQGSVTFLRELRITDNKCALDCGAGIGRVSKHLLMPRFNCVDMVEQDANFAKTAESYCTLDAGATLGYPNRLGEIYNMGLQSFTPSEKKYDLIWSQWVLGHLTDEDLLGFFQRLQIGLKQGGYFVIKENVTSSKSIEKDDMDSSITRPLRAYEDILRKSGFKIVKTTKQTSFPKGLYPVFMIACRVRK